QRSPRLYDGFDVLLDAPARHAKLRVRLTADGDRKPPVEIEVPLTDILADSVTTDLDQQGTRLLVRRVPGDALRVEFDRAHLVFAPGESFALRVRPNLLDDGNNDHRQLKTRVRPARSDQILWKQEDVPLRDAVDLTIPLPTSEGVYDVVLSVLDMPSLPLSSVASVPLRLKKKVLVERKVQVIVLDQRPPEPPRGPETPRTVAEIDPTNAKWWEKFAKTPAPLTKLPLGKWSRLGQGPLGSGDLGFRDHPLGKLAQLGPSVLPRDVSWEAYTLPVEQLDKPHVLEVEYPSDVPQQLGISVLEPNAAETLMPIQLDSGVDLAEEVVGADGQKPRMLRHRLVFWPHTKSPLVLITNQSAASPAVYGKIRVLDGGSRLPALAADEKQDGRLLAAYFDRPLFPESVCATEAYDAWSRRSLDDWLTFHQGGTRLVEYLRHAGMNGAMISVLSEGGTLYPSRRVQPTPRYDKGPFFDSGQDPMRKDVLEMLFRLFDRQGMRLIPAVEFAAPLPELEAMLRAGGPECKGIQWVGPEGLTWEQVHRTYRRQAPYYNVLDPRVQAAMSGVVRELVENHARGHESFAGVAVQLAGYGYAQLPGLDWGMDDATITRFERETGLRVPIVPGPGRHAARHAYLTGPGRNAWIKWRCDCLGRFYHRLQSEIAAVQPGARLYLTTANLLAGPDWPRRLRPTLSRSVTLDELLLEAGINPAAFRGPDGPLLVRAQHVTPPHSTDARAAELALSELLGAGEPNDGPAAPASLYFHPPRELRLESFDAQSPYRPSYTLLHSQLVPSDRQNRRRFIHELAAADTRAFFDGGDLLPMGQQDALADLVAAYRRLPPVAMRRLTGPAARPSIQPVTVRYATHEGKTYVYAVNDSPARVSLSVQVTTGPNSRLEPLVESRPVGALTPLGDKQYWRVELAPYDLIAARLTEPGASFAEAEVSLPGEVRDSLALRIRELGDRLGDLRVPPPLDCLSNAGFEKPAGPAGVIPGWRTLPPKTEDTKVELQQDTQRPYGAQVVRLGSAGSNVSLLSDPFVPPSTGRLSMFVWLRVPDQNKQPSVELVFEGRLNGDPFLRSGLLGRAVDGYPPKPISD
ncbi:MAG TPA: family 10 glycosylhydrolase, partial [Thermoguttaceae bacterium]|nr:family 10 glycosylhydrolase [Thermoguttaceae bacterium]